MIVILQPQVRESEAFRHIMSFLSNLPRINARIHEERGTHQTLTELYLIGETGTLDKEQIAALPGVERVVRISQEYRIVGRHHDDHRPNGLICWCPAYSLLGFATRKETR